MKGKHLLDASSERIPRVRKRKDRSPSSAAPSAHKEGCKPKPNEGRSEDSSNHPQQPAQVAVLLTGGQSGENSPTYTININGNITQNTFNNVLPSRIHHSVNNALPTCLHSPSNVLVEDENSQLDEWVNEFDDPVMDEFVDADAYLASLPSVEVGDPETDFTTLLQEVFDIVDSRQSRPEHCIPELRSEKDSEKNRTIRRKKGLTVANLKTENRKKKKKVIVFSRQEECPVNCTQEHEHVDVLEQVWKHIYENFPNFKKLKKHSGIGCLMCGKAHNMEPECSFLVCDSVTCKTKSKANFMASAQRNVSDSDNSFSEADGLSTTEDMYQGTSVHEYFIGTEAGEISLWDADRKQMKLPKRCDCRLYVYHCPAYYGIFQTGNHIGEVTMSPKKRNLVSLIYCLVLIIMLINSV